MTHICMTWLESMLLKSWERVCACMLATPAACIQCHLPVTKLKKSKPLNEQWMKTRKRWFEQNDPVQIDSMKCPLKLMQWHWVLSQKSKLQKHAVLPDNLRKHGDFDQLPWFGLRHVLNKTSFTMGQSTAARISLQGNGFVFVGNLLTRMIKTQRDRLLPEQFNSSCIQQILTFSLRFWVICVSQSNLQKTLHSRQWNTDFWESLSTNPCWKMWVHAYFHNHTLSWYLLYDAMVASQDKMFEEVWLMNSFIINDRSCSQTTH